MSNNDEKGIIIPKPKNIILPNNNDMKNDAGSEKQMEFDIDIQIIMEQNHKYFLEYNKLNEANSILKNQLITLTKEKNQLKHGVQKFEVKYYLLSNYSQKILRKEKLKLL